MVVRMPMIMRVTVVVCVCVHISAIGLRVGPLQGAKLPSVRRSRGWWRLLPSPGDQMDQLPGNPYRQTNERWHCSFSWDRPYERRTLVVSENPVSRRGQSLDGAP